MSSREFSEWQAYAQIEPFGEERSDLRAGIIAATIANVYRGDREPYEPKDFMPNFEPQAKQDWQAQLSIVEMLNAAYSGVDNR